MLASLEAYVDRSKLVLYLVDNASTDNTLAIVRDSFPWVKVIACEKNVGFGAGNNTVLSLIESRYHVCINPDIEFTQDSISALVAYLDANPDVAIATPRILNPDGSEQKLPKLRPRLNYLLARRFEKHSKRARQLCRAYTRADEPFSQATDIEVATGCFFVIRTATFKALRGFDQRFFLYFEDADLSLRAGSLGRVVFFPHTEVVHYYERAATKSLRAFAIQIASMLKFFKKSRRKP
jgi:GT2 family glycosyltransferase